MWTGKTSCGGYFDEATALFGEENMHYAASICWMHIPFHKWKHNASYFRQCYQKADVRAKSPSAGKSISSLKNML